MTKLSLPAWGELVDVSTRRFRLRRLANEWDRKVSRATRFGPRCSRERSFSFFQEAAFAHRVKTEAARVEGWERGVGPDDRFRGLSGLVLPARRSAALGSSYRVGSRMSWEMTGLGFQCLDRWYESGDGWIRKLDGLSARSCRVGSGFGSFVSDGTSTSAWTGHAARSSASAEQSCSTDRGARITG